MGGEREFFIDNLLVRIHCIIVMIRWTGLAPWWGDLGGVELNGGIEARRGACLDDVCGVRDHDLLCVCVGVCVRE